MRYILYTSSSRLNCQDHIYLTVRKNSNTFVKNMSDSGRDSLENFPEKDCEAKVVYLDREIRPENPLAVKWDHIVVERLGEADPDSSYMTTNNVLHEVKIDKFYQITLDGNDYVDDQGIEGHPPCLKYVGDASDANDQSSSEKLTDSRHEKDLKTVKIPPHCKLFGTWTHPKLEGYDESNILGELGTLKLNDSKIEKIIPVPENTTQEFLNYYGAVLYKIGDITKFDLNHKGKLFDETRIPVTVTSVGENYIQNYIYSNKAGGVYVEYHRLPHFHMPMNENCGGQLMLGKKIKDKNEFHFSAFKIPYGYAIYTLPGTIHNDCWLLGNYFVCYGCTEDFSTVRILDSEGDVARIRVEGREVEF